MNLLSEAVQVLPLITPLKGNVTQDDWAIWARQFAYDTNCPNIEYDPENKRLIVRAFPEVEAMNYEFWADVRDGEVSVRGVTSMTLPTDPFDANRDVYRFQQVARIATGLVTLTHNARVSS